MITKKSFSNNINVSEDKASVSKKIESLIKDAASKYKKISPKSDEFLYFSIIFLKAAESSLIDSDGNTKVLPNGDRAWGHFDNNYKWSGNVQPHKNNNGDIFPESELRKAASKWIGMPLCRDHESSTVDGIRGIILDTYYDEKLKQVIGLCALDKVNYPDLARKVQTGLVRYGSMGTAVETSVCTTCGNKASTVDQYCEHVTKRSCYGEVNVGLKPIEYSLVVTPAEPGARLLKCIASLKEYKSDFERAGVKNLDSLLGSLSEKEALSLEKILKAACGENGCDLEKRNKIIKAFVSSVKISKNAKSNINTDKVYSLIDNMSKLMSGASKAQEMGIDVDGKKIESLLNSLLSETSSSMSGSEGLSEYSEIAPNMGTASPTESVYLDGDELGENGVYPEEGFNTIKQEETADVLTANNKSLLKKIKEGIMNKKLSQRSARRRKIAYHQGGSEGIEPSGFKSETYSFEEDKHMKQTGAIGSGDSAVKEKLSRAKLEERRLRRMAYHQGGSEGLEPSGFQSKPYSFEEDKHMKQTGAIGSGDISLKQKLSRASYKTRFIKRRASNGNVDKANSIFEVYQNDKLVLRTTAGNIFGSELNSNWNWITSRDYGKAVIAEIRNSGLNKVASLLKQAQEMPAPEMPMPDLGGDEGGLGDMPDLGGDEGGLGDMPDLGGDDPAAAEEAPDMEEEAEEAAGGIDAANEALADIETSVTKIREVLEELSNNEVEVNINLQDEGKGDDGEAEGAVKLSRDFSKKLKRSIAALNDSAEEMALVSDAYSNYKNLNSSQKKQLRTVASSSIRECGKLLGESEAICASAKSLSSKLSKIASGLKSSNSKFARTASSSTSLVDEAVKMRVERRASLVRNLEKRTLSARAQRRANMLKAAGEGHEMAGAPMAMDGMAMDEKGHMAYHDGKGPNHEGKDQDHMGEGHEMKGADHMGEDHMGEGHEMKGEGHMGYGHMGKGHEMHHAQKDSKASLKSLINKNISSTQENIERENYKIKLRRAYDIGITMQKKGLISATKTALDKQVDDIMQFDDNAFEAFKRSIANAKSVKNIKIASDLGGVNIGTQNPSESQSKSTTDILSSLWD